MDHRDLIMSMRMLRDLVILAAGIALMIAVVANWAPMAENEHAWDWLPP